MALDPSGWPMSAGEIERQLFAFCRPTLPQTPDRAALRPCRWGTSLHARRRDRRCRWWPRRRRWTRCCGPARRPAGRRPPRRRWRRSVTSPVETAERSAAISMPVSQPMLELAVPAPARRRGLWTAGAARQASGGPRRRAFVLSRRRGQAAERPAGAAGLVAYRGHAGRAEADRSQRLIEPKPVEPQADRSVRVRRGLARRLRRSRSPFGSSLATAVDPARRHPVAARQITVRRTTRRTSLDQRPEPPRTKRTCASTRASG